MPKAYGQRYTLAVTTQGPLYPPAEVMDAQGNFVVIGQIPQSNGFKWGGAIVDKNSPLPAFGHALPYTIISEVDALSAEQLAEITLYTLPLPLPLNNYPMVFCAGTKA